MRGPISDGGAPTAGIAMPLRRVVPSVYHGDPLFLELCAAFDELLAPLVTAVDCFPAYLDPLLAPADFLPWLAALAGCADPERAASGTPGERERVARAAADHALRGTAAGVRQAAARAAGVPVDRVTLEDPGGTRWSAVPGGAAAGGLEAGRGRARLLVGVPDGADTEKVLAAVRAAIGTNAGVHCGIAVEAAPERRAPRGARTYGGAS